MTGFHAFHLLTHKKVIGFSQVGPRTIVMSGVCSPLWPKNQWVCLVLLFHPKIFMEWHAPQLKTIGSGPTTSSDWRFWLRHYWAQKPNSQKQTYRSWWRPPVNTARCPTGLSPPSPKVTWENGAPKDWQVAFVPWCCRVSPIFFWGGCCKWVWTPGCCVSCWANDR